MLTSRKVKLYWFSYCEEQHSGTETYYYFKEEDRDESFEDSSGYHFQQGEVEAVEVYGPSAGVCYFLTQVKPLSRSQKQIWADKVKKEAETLESAKRKLAAANLTDEEKVALGIK